MAGFPSSNFPRVHSAEHIDNYQGLFRAAILNATAWRAERDDDEMFPAVRGFEWSALPQFNEKQMETFRGFAGRSYSRPQVHPLNYLILGFYQFELYKSPGTAQSFLKDRTYSVWITDRATPLGYSVTMRKASLVPLETSSMSMSIDCNGFGTFELIQNREPDSVFMARAYAGPDGVKVLDITNSGRTHENIVFLQLGLIGLQDLHDLKVSLRNGELKTKI